MQCVIFIYRYRFTQDWPTSSRSLCSEPGSAKPGGDRATFGRWYLRSGACVVLKGFQDFLMESLVWIYGLAHGSISIKAIIGGWIWLLKMIGWYWVALVSYVKDSKKQCHLTVISFKAETFVWLEHLGLKTKPESTCQALGSYAATVSNHDHERSPSCIWPALSSYKQDKHVQKSFIPQPFYLVHPSSKSRIHQELDQTRLVSSSTLVKVCTVQPRAFFVTGPGPLNHPGFYTHIPNNRSVPDSDSMYRPMKSPAKSCPVPKWWTSWTWIEQHRKLLKMYEIASILSRCQERTLSTLTLKLFVASLFISLRRFFWFYQKHNFREWSNIEPYWAKKLSPEVEPPLGSFCAVLGSFQASERVVPIFAQKVPSPCLPSDATTAAPSTAVVTPPSCAAPIAAVAYQKIRPSSASRRVMDGDGWWWGDLKEINEMSCLKIPGTFSSLDPASLLHSFSTFLSDQIWQNFGIFRHCGCGCVVVAYCLLFVLRCCLLEWNMSCRSCSSVVPICRKQSSYFIAGTASCRSGTWWMPHLSETWGRPVSTRPSCSRILIRIPEVLEKGPKL